MNLSRVAKHLALLVCACLCLTFMSKLEGGSDLQVRDYTANSKQNAHTSRVPEQNSETTYNWSAAAMRFHARKEHLSNVCHWNSQFHMKRIWRKNSNFLIDVPRRLLICAVPKAGSTTWHRILWSLQRNRNGLSTDQNLYSSSDTVHNQGMAGKLSLAEGTKLVRRVLGDDTFWKDPPEGSSYRLILTRHPFARLISGWNQKFMLKSNYWVYLFKTFKGLMTFKKEIDENHVMSFADFARYVVENGGPLDSHFMPSTTLCQPCSYDYTYVVKAESVDADDPWLMRRLNLTHIDVGRRGIPPGGSLVNDNLVENIKKYMSKLEPPLVEKLHQFYGNDFKYFGYTFNFTTLEAGGFD